MKFWLIHLAMSPRQILLLTWIFIWYCYCYMLVHMILGVYFTYSFASLLLSKGNMLEYMGHGVIDVKSQLALSSFLNTYKPSTCFMVVKMVLLNYYNPTTGFPVVKTCLPNTYKPSTCFAVVKWARQLRILPQPFRVILNPGKFGCYGGHA